MKKIILTVLILSSSLIFSQGVPIGGPSLGSPLPVQNRLDGDLFNFYAQSGYTRVDYARIMIPKKTPNIKGNIHAFKSWDNRGVLNVDKKAYRLNNVNFNIWTNTIESQVGKDSIYIFDLANVNYASINNRKFKSFYFSKKNKNQIFEVLHDGEDIQVLKYYEIEIKRGEVDPLMVEKKMAKFLITKSYYIKEGINIKKIALKKKNILPLFKDKSNQVSQFVKENNLSYKKEKDLKKIFNYYRSI